MTNGVVTRGPLDAFFCSSRASSSLAGNKRQRDDDDDLDSDDDDVPATAPIPAPVASSTLTELARVSQPVALQTWRRLRWGYTDARSGSGYPAAVANRAGCLLAQKATQRAVRDSI